LRETPKLATQIRKAHRANPGKRPAELAEELATTPKYVSKILRRAKVKKFRRGPAPKPAALPSVMRSHDWKEKE